MPPENNAPHHLKIDVVAGVVIFKAGQILLVQERKSHAYGKWNFPGGRVEVAETIEAGAVREAKEETGYDVALDQALPVIHKKAGEPVLHPFAAHIIGGELRVQENEILAAQWFSVVDIRAMSSQLRHPPYIYESLDALSL